MYDKIKESKLLETMPEFNKKQPELVRENAKELSRNFFSRNEMITDYANHRDRANTVQVDFSSVKINNDENTEKKKIKLNVDSPKFTAKAMPKTDNMTFNPLNNLSNHKNSFNKFDEFDPSAN